MEDLSSSINVKPVITISRWFKYVKYLNFYLFIGIILIVGEYKNGRC
jgi:hypothetical protein